MKVLWVCFLVLFSSFFPVFDAFSAHFEVILDITQQQKSDLKVQEKGEAWVPLAHKHHSALRREAAEKHCKAVYPESYVLWYKTRKGNRNLFEHLWCLQLKDAHSDRIRFSEHPKIEQLRAVPSRYLEELPRDFKQKVFQEAIKHTHSLVDSLQANLELTDWFEAPSVRPYFPNWKKEGENIRLLAARAWESSPEEKTQIWPWMEKWVDKYHSHWIKAFESRSELVSYFETVSLWMSAEQLSDVVSLLLRIHDGRPTASAATPWLKALSVFTSRAEISPSRVPQKKLLQIQKVLLARYLSVFCRYFSARDQEAQAMLEAYWMAGVDHPDYRTIMVRAPLRPQERLLYAAILNAEQTVNWISKAPISDPLELVIEEALEKEEDFRSALLDFIEQGNRAWLSQYRTLSDFSNLKKYLVDLPRGGSAYFKGSLSIPRGRKFTISNPWMLFILGLGIQEKDFFRAAEVVQVFVQFWGADLLSASHFLKSHPTPLRELGLIVAHQFLDNSVVSEEVKARNILLLVEYWIRWKQNPQELIEFALNKLPDSKAFLLTLLTSPWVTEATMHQFLPRLIALDPPEEDLKRLVRDAPLMFGPWVEEQVSPHFLTRQKSLAPLMGMY